MYTNFGAELMAPAKEYPVKIRKIPVLDKKTGITYFEIRRTRYDPVRKYEVILSSERTGEKLDPEAGEVVACRPKRGTKRAQRAAGEAAAATSTSTPASTSPATQPEPVPQQTVEPQPTSVTTRVNTGAIDILTMVGKHSGLDAAVRAAYPDGGIADKILSIARYLVATGGDTIHNIDVWQYDHDLPYEFGMSEDVCYDLFESLGYDSTGEQRLFERLSAIDGPDQQVMAFDSTTVSTYADGLKPMARQGYNKDGDGLDTFKLLSFFSLTNQLPVMMDLQPGNIPDVVSVLNAIKRLKTYGLKKPELVLDNGFFSRDNVRAFVTHHVGFTMRATLSDNWIYRLIDEEASGGRLAREKLTNPSSTCPFDPNIHAASFTEATDLGPAKVSDPNGEQLSIRLHYHYYKNRAKAALEEESFLNKLHTIKAKLEGGLSKEGLDPSEQKMCEKFLTVIPKRGRGKATVLIKDEPCKAEMLNFGIFVLISNRHRDPWQALTHYRRRNDIEMSYHMIKSELDGARARCWDMKRVRGKELCRLIALGYRFYLQNALKATRKEAEQLSRDEECGKVERDRMAGAAAWLKKMSLRQFLGWFDCVETVTVRNKRAKSRWSTESTTRDRLVLQMLKENMARSEVKANP